MNETEFSYYFSIIEKLFPDRNPQDDAYFDLIESDIDLIRKYNRNTSISFYTHFNINNNRDDQKKVVTLMYNILEKLNYYIEG